jgi:(1->4)-alpha-D-glucan 1-alpha-D-glucosylmutase
MRPFRATYRLQFRQGFDLDAATGLLPYLDRLGISHVYAAPLTRATSESTHGYDVCAFDEIDPALGGDAAFGRFVEGLQAHGMGLLLDFVPNHMAASVENPWWRSVLELGEESPFAGFFDIDWAARSGATPGKVLVPVLGDLYEKVLEAGELKLAFEPRRGVPEVRFHEKRFPVNPDTWPLLFEGAAEVAERAAAGDPEARVRVERGLERVNAERARLHAVLEAQRYRLAHWRAATFAINYRRFFDINELVGLRIDRAPVFEAVHSFVLTLIAGGVVDGLRLDHIDGLRDPAAYLHRLEAVARQSAGAARFPLYVEKILGPGELLRRDWPVEGTTGYETLSRLTGLCVDPEGEAALSETYGTLSGAETDFEAVVDEAKRFVLTRLFAGELDALSQRAAEVAGHAVESRDIPQGALREALTELLVAFPVYRSYVTRPPAEGDDAELLGAAVAAARQSCPEEASAGLDFLEWLLCEGRFRDDPAATELVLRLQQLSGPVMAKALEDTAFYRYQRLIALNEVGGEPGVFGTAPEALHAAAALGQADWPRGLLASSSHDTKFGEDVRARLTVLSEVPDAWRDAAAQWLADSEPFTQPVGEGAAPEAAMRYRFFQTLLGSWPLELQPEDAAGMAAFRERLQGTMEKTIREAKERTRWTARDPDYEAAVAGFVARATDPQQAPELLRAVKSFVDRIAPAGAANALAQTLLKLTLPGVPDVYQGAELWNLSLVDPDNRRPVDYAARRTLLERDGALPDLLDDWRSGAVKQRLVARVLELRRAWPALFTDGDYRPLEVAGGESRRVFAFARTLGSVAAVVAVPRLAMPLLEESGRPSLAADAWGDTRVLLPPELQDRSWRPVVGEAGAGLSEGRLPVSQLFGGFPGCLLLGDAA